ncbi:hypothetical protein [Mesonia aquimarina]|uniref:hypothetical protein n=1 Tax=Mesonia aquimarina TaxID=1504967 RepID=UPI0013CF25C4|nr:hypothetical protein [Mesonia aquimarina]
MPQVQVRSLNPVDAEKRREILQHIEDSLDNQQLERLGKIAQSSKAKEYLTANSKFLMLKSFLKL